MPKKIVTENHVKAVVKEWLDARGAWSYAPIQNGLGVHGIHDRIACMPITVTQAMVGKRIGLFVSVESKRPGRRRETNRGMSAHQVENMRGITDAGGLSICCDGLEDLDVLHALLDALRETT